MSATKKALQRRRDKEVMTEVSRRSTSKPSREEIAVKARKRIMGMLLLPACLFAILILGELLFHAAAKGGFWRQEGFWFFTVGCVCWLALAVLRKRPVIAYVFAHEMTHVLALWLSLGRAHEFSVTEKGGYVAASKSNWFITLAPYLLPFYTLIVFALWGLASLLHGLNDEITLPLYFWHPYFKWSWIFYYWVGVTWSFHISFTLEVLKTEQSDLLQNGEFFSLMLIFGGNLAVLGALFIFTAPLGVSWHGIWNDAVGCVLAVWDALVFICNAIWHLVRNDK